MATLAFDTTVNTVVGTAFDAACTTARGAVRLVRSTGGDLIRTGLAGSEQPPAEDMASEDDPGLFGPESVVWLVHGDPAMVIGGLRSLLIQTLHPLAMAGVANHSDYRADPIGRLHRTGRFIGVTTFGSTEAAERSIEIINRVHLTVTGTAPDGRPYAASDPHLLLWVHVTEVDSFLAAYRRHGAKRLSPDQRDRYVAEMAEIGVRLGVDPDEVPRSVAELTQCLEDFRPELRFDAQARETVRFLLFPPIPLATRGFYAITFAAATASLPRWARNELWLPVFPGTDAVAIQPAATAMTRAMGWFLNKPGI